MNRNTSLFSIRIRKCIRVIDDNKYLLYFNENKIEN